MFGLELVHSNFICPGAYEQVLKAKFKLKQLPITFHSKHKAHTTYSWNIKWQKCVRMGLNGFIFKKLMKIKILKRKKNPGIRLEVAC